jgi:hypothetical protein
MTIRDMSAAGIALALTAAPLAAAGHDLACDQTVGGATAIVVQRYPAKLHFNVTIRNVHPTDASTVSSVSAPLLERLGFAFTPAAPFTLPVGGQASAAFDLVVKSRAACEALAAGTMPMHPSHPGMVIPSAYGESCSGGDHRHDGDRQACDGEHHDGDHHGDGHGDGDHHDGDDDGAPCTTGLCHDGAFLDSIFVATFDMGAAECRARIVCGAEDKDDHDRDDGDRDGEHDGDGDHHDDHDRDGGHDDDGHGSSYGH